MPGDEDVVEDKPGACPKCHMPLVSVRLDQVWTCPVHAAVIKDQPGKCPLDSRDLVPVTMSVSWACPGAPASEGSLSPGAPGSCPDGSSMERKYAPRAHGNHNPQHGGSFFMAPDNWHHIEGAYYAPGVFRLFLYDDFTKPLPLAQLRTTTARVMLTAQGKELPLVPNGRFLEAKVGKLPFPAAMQGRVKFKADSPEYLFDFTFDKYSKDLPAPATSAATLTASSGPAPATPGGTPPGVTPGAAQETAAAPPTPGVTGSAAPGSTAPLVETVPLDSALVSTPIPETIPEMLAQLRARNDQIKAFIDRGSFASVYVPAFQAKDVALALDAKKGGLSEDRQKRVSPAVNRLVRTAYLLDAFGDLGNKQQIADAYTQFAAAVQDIESAFPQQP
jgi:hypothetical protein